MSSSRLRPLREEDAEAVASLFVECFGDARLVDPDEIRSWVRNAELEPEWLRVLEEDGRVAGYGDIWPQGDELALDAAAPGRWDVFFDWAEEEAGRRHIPRVRMQLPHGHELARVLEARGYRPWRHSLTMEIALDTEPARSGLPDGLELRAYRDDDRDVLIAAVNESFAADPFHHHVTPSSFREFFLGARGFDPALFLLAWDGAELAGYALDYPEQGSDAELGWVANLGVRPRWRRRGLGEALLHASFAELYARGLRRVGLGVDAQNATGALRLYERVGMRQARRSDNWRKHL
jgi:ribosomal protein S18 acetylase RimI-like enzyme